MATSSSSSTNPNQSATVNPFTLAFIVGARNEHAIVHYISEHFDSIRRFTLLITETEANALKEKFAKTGLDIRSLPSLERRGDVELATRMGKCQVSAVIIMNYAAISKLLTGERLAVLLEKAWVFDIPVCLNAGNVELVINNLVTLKGLAGGGGSDRSKSREEEMIAVLQTRYPTFDIELSDQEIERRQKRGKWMEQQLCFWLENSKLEFLKPVLKTDPPDKYAAYATPETQYFTRDDELTNFFKFKSAPLDKSVEYLTVGPAARIRDIWNYPIFERDFLISHHLFMSSVDLLKELRKRYNAPPPVAPDGAEGDYKPSSAVIVVLRDWILMEYGSDFAGNKELEKEFDDFMNFLKTEVKDDTAETARELSDMLHTALAIEPPYPVDLKKAPEHHPSKKNKEGKFDLITSFVPQELARQMTLLDEHLFHKVRAKEFLGGAWTKKDALERAPNLTKFINHTNRMAAWVVTEILREKNPRFISELIIKFIHTGKELLELRNYSGVMNILTSLHSATISRLKSAWQLVPNKERKDFDDLTESLSLLGHYKNYRETLKSLPPSTPCIPLIPVTCSDLNGLGEVLENVTEQGWINWDKHSKVANHIWSVKRFMRARYILQPVEEIQSYISDAEVWEGEKTLAAIAKMRELHGGRLSDKLTETSKKVKQPKEKEEKKSTKDLKLSERDWALLNAGSEVKKFSAGQEILGLDVINRHLFRVKKGTVRVEKIVDGNVVVIDRMKEKSMFGEISMLLRNEQGTTTAAIVADENGTEIIKYKIDFVMDMCRSEPTLSAKLHKIISLKLSSRLRNFGSKSTEKRKEDQSEEKEQSEDEKSEAGPVPVEDKQEPTHVALRKETRGSRQLSAPFFDNGVPATSHAEVEKISDKRKLEKKSSQARMAAQKSKSKKDVNQDDAFQKWFVLPESEIIVRTFNCALKSTITAQGTLYLSPNYLCFSANVFGRKTKDKFQFSTIQDLKPVDKKLVLTTKNGAKTIIKDFEKEGTNFEEVYTMIKNFYEQARTTKASTDAEKEEERSDHEEDGGLAPSDEDWTMILEGTRSIHYRKDEYVIVENQEPKQRLYQIAKGSCRITKKGQDGKILILGEITSHDSIFGEISFLEGTAATASVVANSEEDTVVRVIEGYYLEVLFSYYPALSGRFYHYLATVLSTRLKLRNQSSQEKAKKEKEKEKEKEVESEKLDHLKKAGLNTSTSTPEEDDTEEGSLGSSKAPAGLRVPEAKKKKRRSSKRVVVGAPQFEEALVQVEKKDKKEKTKKDKKKSEELQHQQQQQEDKQD